MIVDSKVVQTTPEEKVQILALSRVEGLGVHTFLRLYERFGTVSNIIQASHDSLCKVVSPAIAHGIIAIKSDFAIADYLTILTKKDISYATVLDSKYPQILREISDPPLILYAKGECDIENIGTCFAVVGTRKCSRYGEMITQEIVRGLVEVGFTIVSGLAFGIDLVAHKSALKYGGKTVAVISGRVDHPVPVSNAKTYRAILSQGCAVSETHLDTVLMPGMFASRNRIIAGLSVGTIVIEADQKSGALITARLALDEGREVFAVPGNIGEQTSRGTNELIKKGEAKLVQSVYDILDEFDITLDQKENKEQVFSNEELVIKNVLLQGGATIDELVFASKLEVKNLTQVVTRMELDGKITKIENGKYVLKS